MFVGHYGISFSAKRVEPSIPLWVLFLAVQLLDVLWAPLILLGIEKVRIVPGFTASNPLDLYYMPYTHSLVAAILWSCAGGLAYRFLARPSRSRASFVIGLAVFSCSGYRPTSSSDLPPHPIERRRPRRSSLTPCLRS